MVRGYYRRRGWQVWHAAALARVQDFPALHELTGEHEPAPQETEEDIEARIYRNSMAWVIVTGGNAEPEPAPEKEPA